MTIEEKAKAYDKAKSIMEKYLKSGNAGVIAEKTTKKAFPDFRENEDEKIRKELIEQVIYIVPDKNEVDDNGNTLPCYTTRINKYIAWLEKQGTSYTKRDVDDAYVEGIAFAKDELKKQYEANYQIRKDIATFIFNYKGVIKDRAKWIDYLGIKVSFVEEQGEQRPADKVEPKSEIIKDKWYICTCTITDHVSFMSGSYCSEDTRIWFKKGAAYLGNDILKYDLGFEPEDYQDYFRLWTIQDAKDGDVLSIKRNQHPFIYRGFTDINRPKAPVAHCGINCYNEFTKQRRDENWFWTGDEVEPATKEQRDLLFIKMKEAGYEWDAEKKELNKLK